MVSHWDENDVVAKEIFYNVRLTPLKRESPIAHDNVRLFPGLVSLHVHRTSNLIIIPPAAICITVYACVPNITSGDTLLIQLDGYRHGPNC